MPGYVIGMRRRKQEDALDAQHRRIHRRRVRQITNHHLIAQRFQPRPRILRVHQRPHLFAALGQSPGQVRANFAVDANY